MHTIVRSFASAILALALAPLAHADQCASMMTTTTVMCESATYSTGAKNKYTLTFGPGDAFSAAGASKNNKGDTATGTYTCFGNNYFSLAYTDGFGDHPTATGKFPSTVFGNNNNGPTGNYVFSARLTSGACP